MKIAIVGTGNFNMQVFKKLITECEEFKTIEFQKEETQMEQFKPELFVFEATPNMIAFNCPKLKHQPKGYERPYKFHK